MSRLINFLKKWTLPVGMSGGVLIFLAFHYLDFLTPLKPAAHSAAEILTPLVLFLMLFITFCKVNPREMRVKVWHIWVLAFQVLTCVAIGLFLHFTPGFRLALLAEGLMICLVCPTAGAAAVVTGKLGGDRTTITTYTILSNLAAAVVIPLVFPMVEPHVDAPFIQQFYIILRRVFPLLIFPFLLAWGFREFLPGLHARFTERSGDAAFYLWGFGLVLSVGQTCIHLFDSPVSVWTKLLLSIVSLMACVLQFVAGKKIGSAYNDRISAGQGLGQKNTIFAIWASYTYLSPVLSVVPGTYIIWQNIFNSWQLWRKQKADAAISQGR